MNGYSVKLPLRIDTGDGAFLMNKDIKEVINQNFKMLLLTNPGERVMNTDYGIGAKRLLFHNRGDNFSEIDLESVIVSQIAKYMPYIIIDSFNVQDYFLNDNGVYIEIKYSIPSINSTDTITLILNQT